jgi:hypothetical protein
MSLCPPQRGCGARLRRDAGRGEPAAADSLVFIRDNNTTKDVRLRR